MGGDKSVDPVIVGWWYYLDVHFIFGHGPIDSVDEIKVGGRTLNIGGGVTSNQTVTIDKPSLFGGREREGGCVGNIDVMLGASNQPTNGFLQARVGDSLGVSNPTVPAYRGLAGLFFRGYVSPDSAGAGDWTANNVLPSGPFGIRNYMRSSFMWVANNPYFKPVMVKYRRNPRATTGITGNRTILVNGVLQANPAHIIAEVLTSKSYIGGIDPDMLDAQSFIDAASTLQSEGLGLGIKWDTTTTRRAFIRRILDHINGVLNTDVNTGKFFLTLIRDDYDEGTLEILDETNCVVTEYSTRGAADTVNEVVVTYVRGSTGEPDTVAVQNTANILTQGRVVTHEQEYDGVHSQELALKLAYRDLATLSKPLAKVSLKTNRIGRDLYPGAVFKLQYPSLGIDSLICRVVQRDLGGLDSGEIYIDAVQDVFADPVIDTSDIQDTVWIPSESDPVETTAFKLFEMPYAMVLRSTAEVERDYFTATPCFGAMVAEPPIPDAFAFGLYDVDITEKVADGNYGIFGELSTAIGKDKAADTQVLTNVSDPFNLPSGDIAIGLLGDELVRITAYDAATQSVTFDRGVYDTVPADHAAGTTLYFLGFTPFEVAFDKTERAPGETARYKILTQTTVGYLDPSGATQHDFVMDERYNKPYPPGNITINTADYPTYVSGQLALGWAHRDRVAQEDVPVLQNAASVGPEASTTYEIDIYDRDDVLLRSEVGLTGVAYTYTDEVADAGELQGRLRVVIRSERGGLLSHQAHDITFDRAGYALNYGLYYGGGT